MDTHDCTAPRGSRKDIKDRLAVLARYRKQTGTDGFPQKSNDDPEYKAFAQWLYRIRKDHNGGQLTTTAVAMLTAAGIPLSRTDVKAQRIARTTRASFEENLANLLAWLDAKELRSGLRDLSYQESLLDEAARQSYRFVEHMQLKARQAILSAEHRRALCDLDFTVNGKWIGFALQPKPSIRSPLHMEHVRQAQRPTYGLHGHAA